MSHFLAAVLHAERNEAQIDAGPTTFVAVPDGVGVGFRRSFCIFFRVCVILGHAISGIIS